MSVNQEERNTQTRIHIYLETPIKAVNLPGAAVTFVVNNTTQPQATAPLLAALWPNRSEAKRFQVHENERNSFFCPDAWPEIKPSC